MEMFAPRIMNQDTAAAIMALNNFYSTSITELPVFYNWFGDSDAVRFYNRFIDDFYLSNFKVQSTSNTVTSLYQPIEANSITSPNPFNSSIKVNYTGYYQVISLDGTIINQGQTSPSNEVDLSSLQPGPYQLVVTKEVESIRELIIKQ